VFQQYSILQRLVPALDLALGLRVVRCTADMTHAVVAEPVGKFVRHVTRAVVREQSRFLHNLSLVAARCLQGELQCFSDIVTRHAGAQLPGNHVARVIVQYRRIQFSSFRTNGRPLTGSTIAIEGLGPIQTDVLVQIELADDTRHSTILRAGNDTYVIPEQATSADIAVSYWGMGTIHILEGMDHLLFLLVLLLIINGLWPLIKTVTAFTIAHSLTLALATLGLVNIPPAPTEAVIALSIMLLAVEAVRKSQGQLTLAERYPWLIAFTFGLVHGLGFAGALSEIGVPQNDVPLALLMFNLGVETGQVMFVVGVSLLLVGIRKLHNHSADLFLRATPYAIGGLAAFWTIQRIDLFL